MAQATDKTTTPASGLSAEDEAAVARWRAEVGEERFRRIVAAEAARTPGRPNLFEQRKHLLLALAQMEKTRPKRPLRAMVREIVSSPAGQAEVARSQSADALSDWLRKNWNQHRQAMHHEFERRRQKAPRSSPVNVYEIAGMVSKHAALLAALLPEISLPKYMLGISDPGLIERIGGPSQSVQKAMEALGGLPGFLPGRKPR
jgi:hypothetical protein